jgi:hypothetical protein|tara:strand:- start:12 stop:254 length:243 start_codon:yes stop_codon:yes gene_type:complete
MARKKSLSIKQFTEQATGVRLSSHEKLCAERMRTLHEAIMELKTEVKSLRQDVLKGKGAISVLIGLGAVIATVVGWMELK